MPTATTPGRTTREHSGLAGWMIGFLYGAVMLAALREPDELIASVVFSLTLTALAAFGAAALFAPGGRRPFARGFAFFGTIYLVLSLAPFCYVGVRPALITNMAFDELFNVWVAPVDISTNTRQTRLILETPGPVHTMFAARLPTDTLSPRYHAFILIGHSAVALAAGFLGGVFVRRLSVATQHDPEAAPGRS